MSPNSFEQIFKNIRHYNYSVAIHLLYLLILHRNNAHTVRIKRAKIIEYLSVKSDHSVYYVYINFYACI